MWHWPCFRSAGQRNDPGPFELPRPGSVCPSLGRVDPQDLAPNPIMQLLTHAPSEVSPLTAELHGRLHKLPHDLGVMDSIVSGRNSPAVPITNATTTRPPHDPLHQYALATLKSRPQEAGPVSLCDVDALCIMGWSKLLSHNQPALLQPERQRKTQDKCQSSDPQGSLVAANGNATVPGDALGTVRVTSRRLTRARKAGERPSYSFGALASRVPAIAAAMG